MDNIVQEGSAKIKVKSQKIVSKEMDVFYNPVMGFNRDVSVLLLESIENKNMQIADPLAASGIRSIRFLKELSKNKIKNISINDYDKGTVKSIKDNFELNKIKIKNSKKISIHNEDATLFLMKSSGFDYIDIDPFGTPNPFLDAACRRISRNGILAVTATDTSALAGTFPSACKRKYWAIPRKDAVMHETGLRILIRKIQLVGAQYDKALVPVFSYSKEHYMRGFLRSEKGKNKADDVLKQHGMLNGAGPMWIGKLWDEKLVTAMYKNSLTNKIFNTQENQRFSVPRNFKKISWENKELIKFLKTIKEESKINSACFYDLHEIAEKNKINLMLKKDEIIKRIKKSGYSASNTHFAGTGIRSDATMEKIVKILKSS
ncbi:MAG TPA: tRNA (guanine(26)-N(2))-dimethyltransferase [Candidatus Nanoarchaeia archaeon]|nr:tRNA (guanine(26)-N(2))-dimethyltransferase [Candidatus Nanoarchaeia archaeon]